MVADPLREEMIEKLKVLSIKDGDLVILSLAPNTFMDERAWRAVNTWLKATGRENVRVMDIGPGGDATILDEETEGLLNKLGFYRLSPCEVCAQHPAPHEVLRVEEDETLKANIITVRRYCARHKP